jgi:hypothetical protein
VLYSNFSPLVIVLVGKRGVNVGLLHALLPEIRLKLESVRESTLPPVYYCVTFAQVRGIVGSA